MNPDLIENDFERLIEDNERYWTVINKSVDRFETSLTDDFLDEFKRIKYLLKKVSDLGEFRYHWKIMRKILTNTVPSNTASIKNTSTEENIPTTIPALPAPTTPSTPPTVEDVSSPPRSRRKRQVWTPERKVDVKEEESLGVNPHIVFISNGGRLFFVKTSESDVIKTMKKYIMKADEVQLKCSIKECVSRAHFKVDPGMIVKKGYNCSFKDPNHPSLMDISTYIPIPTITKHHTCNISITPDQLEETMKLNELTVPNETICFHCKEDQEELSKLVFHVEKSPACLETYKANKEYCFICRRHYSQLRMHFKSVSDGRVCHAKGNEKEHNHMSKILFNHLEKNVFRSPINPQLTLPDSNVSEKTLRKLLPKKKGQLVDGDGSLGIPHLIAVSPGIRLHPRFYIKIDGIIRVIRTHSVSHTRNLLCHCCEFRCPGKHRFELDRSLTKPHPTRPNFFVLNTKADLHQRSLYTPMYHSSEAHICRPNFTLKDVQRALDGDIKFITTPKKSKRSPKKASNSKMAEEVLMESSDEEGLDVYDDDDTDTVKCLSCSAIFSNWENMSNHLTKTEDCRIFYLKDPKYCFVCRKNFNQLSLHQRRIFLGKNSQLGGENIEENERNHYLLYRSLESSRDRVTKRSSAIDVAARRLKIPFDGDEYLDEMQIEEMEEDDEDMEEDAEDMENDVEDMGEDVEDIRGGDSSDGLDEYSDDLSDHDEGEKQEPLSDDNVIEPEAPVSHCEVENSQKDETYPEELVTHPEFVDEKLPGDEEKNETEVSKIPLTSV